MADRCYLEKCRDRLYPEFVLGDVAVSIGATGSHATYQSGRHLLQKTVDFYQSSAQARLSSSFGRAYRYMEAVFANDRNPYLSCIDRNMAYLERIRSHGDWSVLRRRPPCVLPDPNGEARLMMLAMQKLRKISDAERDNSCSGTV